MRSRGRTQRIARPLTPADLLALPALSSGQGLLAGSSAVWASLQAKLNAARAAGRSAYVLFGTYHDSRAQVEAFRRALGPLALRGWSAVTVEQLDATGAWRQLPAAEQCGDDTVLDRITHGEGGPQDFAELEARQSRHDYTAWKYGFIDAISDLLLASRALQLPLRGCDMPQSLQRRLVFDGAARERLRELHCLLALNDWLARKPRQPAQVAMLWGQEHVKPHGLPSLLPADALIISIYLFGGRPGPLTPEAELARRLVVNDMLLLALATDQEQLALLLPEAPLGGDVHRSREWTNVAAAGPTLLRFRSEVAGELFISGRRLAVDQREQVIELSSPVGSLAYLLRTGTLRMAGALELAAGSTVGLSFDSPHRATTIHLIAPLPR